MTKFAWAVGSLGLISLAITGCAAGGGNVTQRSLVRQLADLEVLARAPKPAYVTRQASSYDRASTTPADAQTWFANVDVGQYIRVEQRDGRKEYVMLDAAGPGVVVRIWSANPAGTL